MFTPYDDSSERYRKLMLKRVLLNDQINNNDVDHVDVDTVEIDKGDKKEGETMLITFYLIILIILGVHMNGYAIYKTTKVC